MLQNHNSQLTFLPALALLFLLSLSVAHQPQVIDLSSCFLRPSVV